MSRPITMKPIWLLNNLSLCLKKLDHYTEPDIKEWLWVGDYRWTGIERTGRIKLAVSTSADNINYIVIGDNTPFLNSQIIANPSGILKFISLATLWPTFLKDSLILFCISILSFSSKRELAPKI